MKRHKPGSRGWHEDGKGFILGYQTGNLLLGIVLFVILMLIVIFGSH